MDILWPGLGYERDNKGVSRRSVSLVERSGMKPPPDSTGFTKHSLRGYDPARWNKTGERKYTLLPSCHPNNLHTSPSKIFVLIMNFDNVLNFS
jgi:hypothetical protein